MRGVQSDQDDLLRREIIQDLVCNFRLDKRRISRKWGIDFNRRFADELARLDDMVTDGLLELNGDEIVILPPGRLLVRNICMIFDRYQRDGKSGGSFSRTI